MDNASLSDYEGKKGEEKKSRSAPHMTCRWARMESPIPRWCEKRPAQAISRVGSARYHIGGGEGPEQAPRCPCNNMKPPFLVFFLSTYFLTLVHSDT